VVEDFNAVEALVGRMLAAVGRAGLLKPRVLLTMEPGATEVGRRAVQECLRGAGARQVSVADAAICRTVGVGLTPEDPVGSLVLDVGAGGVRASLCSLGGVVHYGSRAAGGDALTEAIRTWLRVERSLEVGLATAENLKQHVVDAAGSSIRQARIRGTGVSGHPEEQVVGSQELEPLVERVVQGVCAAVSEVLAAASPELSADILDRGLVVTGEGALLRGLSDRLVTHTDLPVVLAEPVAHAQIAGATRLLDNPERYRELVPA